MKTISRKTKNCPKVGKKITKELQIMNNFNAELTNHGADLLQSNGVDLLQSIGVDLLQSNHDNWTSELGPLQQMFWV